MITRQFSLDTMPSYPFDQYYDLQKIVFFDIETTGFAAETTYLYLIGCAYYEENSFSIIQWFSEDITEEALLINSFFNFVREYELLLHYNGSGFDLPYLLKKCKQLKLDYSIASLDSIDIYKKIYPYKKIFALNNFKQKTIETFLNINRTDSYSGGDLITVYQSYLGRKHYEELKRRRSPEEPFPAPSESEMLLHQLLLHNEDDIRGLLLISPILSYADLFEKPFRILQAGVEHGILLIQFELSSMLPVRIDYGNDLAHLTAYGKEASLSIRIYEGELKHFYDNYSDYYYLPAEDSVVHKSIAAFVEPEHREKAKPSNCYVKRTGLFAPQYENIFSPYFKLDYKDKLSYLEIHTDFLLQEDTLEKYVKYMLNCLTTK
jgi:uncharacterized protein YprB with RNaseH-like and TPR domain